jgi:hypothetical protein
MFEMEFSGCLNDADLGPAVQGCRNDFDFTLRFEKIFLSILPAAIFIALSIPRIVFLVRRPKVARGLAWQITKQVRSTYSVLPLHRLTSYARSPSGYTPSCNSCC